MNYIKNEDLNIDTAFDTLLNIDEIAWGFYAFSREPLKNKISMEKRYDLILKSNKCGADFAQTFKSKGLNTVKEISEELKAEVTRPDIPSDGGRILFAQYTEPNKISIFQDTINKFQEIIMNNPRIKKELQNISIEEVLLGHELFHMIEYKNSKEIFTRNEKLLLWSFMSYKHKTSLITLSELAAMSFSKEINQLSFSPYILEILLVWGYSEKAGQKLYEEVLEISRTTKNNFL